MAGGPIEIAGRRKPARSSRELWARWTLATTLGELLGLAVPASAGAAAVAAGTTAADYADPPAVVAALGIASGLAMGVVVAAVTGLALVRILRPRRRLRLAERLANPVVRAILRSPLHGLLDRSLVVLSYTGRRSGRQRTLPVMYVRDDGRLLVLAGRPDRKRWWRNFRDPAPVDVVLGGRELHCVGALVGDPGEVERGLATYVRRFPRAARSLGVELDAEGRPDRHSLARAAGRAVVVAIEPRRK